MSSEEELLPLSGLQHLAFCERQWGLIHLEQVWTENPLTVAGHHLHERSSEPGSESRGDLRIARGLRLRSLRLGLVGMADVVEFHRVRASASLTTNGASAAGSAMTGVQLPGAEGWWRVVPIEYKHGRPKPTRCDEVQLCAQALCLEEMLGGHIAEGCLFYGKTHRRHPVEFNAELRAETERLTARLHELTALAQTPDGHYERKCRSCSLLVHCQPKVTTSPASGRVAKYIARSLASLGETESGAVTEAGE